MDGTKSELKKIPSFICFSGLSAASTLEKKLKVIF